MGDPAPPLAPASAGPDGAPGGAPPLTLGRALLLVALVAAATLPRWGLLTAGWLRRRALQPAASDWGRVLWLAGEGEDEVDPALGDRLAAAGVALEVWSQTTAPPPGPARLVLTAEPPPGGGGFLADLDSYRGSLVEVAMQRLGRDLPTGSWLWRAPWVDPGVAPATLPTDLSRIGDAALAGRVVVVGSADPLNGPRGLRGPLPSSRAVAEGLQAALAGSLLWAPRRGWWLLVALLLAAPVALRVRDAGRAAGGRRAATLAGGTLALAGVALAGGVVLDPGPVLVALGAALYLARPAPPPDLRALARRALAAAQAAADPGPAGGGAASRSPGSVPELLAMLPPPLRAARADLYAWILGDRLAPPTEVSALFPDELLFLAAHHEREDDTARRLEVLEWAFLKDPQDPAVREALDDCRDEVEGALALMDLAGIKAAMDARFQGLEMIGQGAMGLILAGEDAGLGRPVAIKVVNPALLGDEDGQARFFREIEALCELTHPHVVQIYGAYPGTLPHYAMEHLQGETLRAALARQGLAPGADLVVAAQLAEAMDYVHGRGVMHRDLKPDNLLLCGAEGAAPRPAEAPWDADTLRLVVIDFGIAKGPGSRALTRAGDVLGTLAYMAPEQVRGEAVDAACDRFTVGVIVYEVLAGEAPFAQASQAAQQPARPLAEARPDLPEALCEAVTRLLDPDPGRRAEDLGELRDALVEARETVF